jgi:uncharacterized membrane protein YfbV (UPF0208 family)
MEDTLYEHRRTLLGGALGLVFGPLVAGVVVGWERALSVLDLVAAVLVALLVLKATSVVVVILVRSVL